MQVGSCVFGAFSTESATLTDHHSVVVAVSGNEAVLVYTTSIKPGESVLRRAYGREFTSEERVLAKWKNRCRYDASQVARVPVSMLTATGGRVPSSVVAAIVSQVQDAARRNELQKNTFNPAHPERVTGAVSRIKREAAFH